MKPLLPNAVAMALQQTGDDLAGAMACLSGAHGLSPSAALSEIADYLGMVAGSAELLQRLAPDFDILSYPECLQRQCLFMHAPGQAQLYLISGRLSLSGDSQFLASVIEAVHPAQTVQVLAEAGTIASMLQQHSRTLRAMDSVDIVPGAPDTHSPADALLHLSLASIENSASPAVRLLDSTLYDALQLGASDIHFEVHNRQMHIKYRLDGVLQSIRQIDHGDTANQVISRIKVLADLDISERRIPQDGRFRILCDHREIDFRVSIMPNLSAEDAVLRILDRKHLTGQFLSLTLDALSFDASVRQFIRNAATLPYGLLLVTGPTGSGKTTTLYAAISEINTGLDKIITIEDPIEYQLPGVLQIPVNEKKGLTFARGLRSVLRHDPDKIMVGEIRDTETAHIAVQASLTGHQVFTTVHANNVFDVFGRFSNMGVDTYSLVAALSGIVAQRLVRLLCTQCAVEVPSTPPAPADARLREARGCAHCRGTGYLGRAAIAETLRIDDDLKNLLVQNAPISVLRQQASAKGFCSLRDAGVAMALSGRTSLAEINRVTPAF